MRRKRTIYFNDARHYYLFVFEPPMALEDAWRPIDEVAGTSVDTFIYGVERGDGLFYPSRAGLQFGSDELPFAEQDSVDGSRQAYAWRTWENMQSLSQRGLDPLRVLIDRSHEKGMEFIASLRIAAYGGLLDEQRIPVPDAWRTDKMEPLSRHLGGDFARQDVRDHQFAVLGELATRYPVDGIELDFAFMPFYFDPEQVQQHLSTMTEYVRSVSEMVRGRSGGPATIGARVLVTEEMCLNGGLDVRTWLKEGLLDFVVPLLYPTFLLDPDMPIDWLVEAAHESDVSVYGMLQPYVRDESRRFYTVEHASAENTRAAAANFWDRGVDGVYTWFMKWPLGDAERRTLTEIGDPQLVAEADKCYLLRRRDTLADLLGYVAAIPLAIPEADPGRRYTIPFYVADDVQADADRVRQVRLRINVGNLVTADRLTLLLNGESLAGETLRRSYGGTVAPYDAQWFELQLDSVRPQKGPNILELSLDSRPRGLEGGVVVEDVEVVVKYGPYPSKPAPSTGS